MEIWMVSATRPALGSRRHDAVADAPCTHPSSRAVLIARKCTSSCSPPSPPELHANNGQGNFSLVSVSGELFGQSEKDAALVKWAVRLRPAPTSTLLPLLSARVHHGSGMTLASLHRT